MALFSNWFKKKTPEEKNESQQPAIPATPPPAPSSPPAAAPRQQATRTVMPNTVKPVSLRAETPPTPAPGARVSTGRSISMPGMSAPPLAVPAANPAAPTSPEAPAQAPTVSSAISGRKVVLELGDFLDRIPGSFLKGGPFDLKQRIEFDASDLYSDLSKGRASVPASIVSRIVPDIFAKEVSDTEDVEIQLPLQKLVEQIGDFQQRPDQIAPEQVAEIETPFLQVAKEDSAKFPKSAPAQGRPPAPPTAPLPAMQPVAPAIAPLSPNPAPISAQTIPGPSPEGTTVTPVQPPGPIAPPTRRTAAPIIPGKRPPATVRASVSGGKIRLSGPALPTRMSPVTGDTRPLQPNIAPISPTAPAQQPPAAATPAPIANLRPAAIKPIPAPPSALPTAPKQEKKVTRRIQIPGIQFKKPEAPATPPPGALTPAPTSLKIPSPFPGTLPPPPPAVPISPPQPPVSAPPMPAFSAPVAPSLPPLIPQVAAEPAPISAPAAIPAAAELPGVERVENISLNLKAILQALPGDSVSGNLGRIDDNAQVVLPFGLIEHQLATGRVSIPLQTFAEALPEELRRMFEGADADAEMPIPLQEIFQSLPSNALKMRADQVYDVVTEEIPTPFSQKANEDKARLAKEASEREAVKAPTPEPEPEPEVVQPVEAEVPPVEPVAEPEPEPVVEKAPEPVEPEAPTPVEESAPEPLEAPESEPPVAVEAAAAPATEPALALPPPAPVIPSLPIAAANVPQKTILPPPVTFSAPRGLPVLPPVMPSIQDPAAETIVEPVSLPVVPPPPLQSFTSAPSAPSKSYDQFVLQAIFMTEENMDARSVARKITDLPGIKGSVVMFGDGLTLAGTFPESYDTPGICAMAPLMFKKIELYTQDLKLGNVQTFTIFADESPISFFRCDNLCLSVLHGTRGFLPGIREKLVEVTRELSKMYGENSES